MDEAEKETGVSWSRRLSLVMEEYLRERRHRSMVDQLDRVHADDGAIVNKDLLKGMKAKMGTILKDRR